MKSFLWTNKINEICSVLILPPSSVVAETGADAGPAATPLNALTRTSYRVNLRKADKLSSVADQPFTVSVLENIQKEDYCGYLQSENTRCAKLTQVTWDKGKIMMMIGRQHLTSWF